MHFSVSASCHAQLKFIHCRREGKKMVEALYRAQDVHPREVIVEPKGAMPTVARDMRVFKHMGTLTKAGQW